VSPAYSAAPPTAPHTIHRLGPYEILGLLGRGGMGEVHRAHDTRLGRDVALKIFRGGDPRLAERFVREARAQARVDHSAVCPVYEAGEADGVRFIAMRLVKGRTLGEAAPDLPLAERVRLVKEAAEGLHAAHLQGLIHRDVKPSNICPQNPILGCNWCDADNIVNTLFAGHVPGSEGMKGLGMGSQFTWDLNRPAPLGKLNASNLLSVVGTKDAWYWKLCDDGSNNWGSYHDQVVNAASGTVNQAYYRDGALQVAGVGHVRTLKTEMNHTDREAESNDPKIVELANMVQNWLSNPSNYGNDTTPQTQVLPAGPTARGSGGPGGALRGRSGCESAGPCPDRRWGRGGRDFGRSRRQASARGGGRPRAGPPRRGSARPPRRASGSPCGFRSGPPRRGGRRRPGGGTPPRRRGARSGA